MKLFITLSLIVIFQNSIAQNTGVGITTPRQKLHVANGLSGNILPLGPLVVESNNNTYINLLSADDKETALLFGKTGNAASGSITYNNIDLANGFQFRTNGNSIPKMVIDQFGRVGIGISTPSVTFQVGGSAIIGGHLLTGQLAIVAGGDVTDFLIKVDGNGDMGFRKGYQGSGLNYIIAVQGNLPSTTGPVSHNNYIGEIRLFAGGTPPFGWLFCNGQLLAVSTNAALFSVIGSTYGGDGVNVFALPDLRDKVPVHPGDRWTLGEISN